MFDIQDRFSRLNQSQNPQLKKTVAVNLPSLNPKKCDTGLITSSDFKEIHYDLESIYKDFHLSLTIPTNNPSRFLVVVSDMKNIIFRAICDQRTIDLLNGNGHIFEINNYANHRKNVIPFTPMYMFSELSELEASMINDDEATDSIFLIYGKIFKTRDEKNRGKNIVHNTFYYKNPNERSIIRDPTGRVGNQFENHGVPLGYSTRYRYFNTGAKLGWHKYAVMFCFKDILSIAQFKEKESIDSENQAFPCFNLMLFYKFVDYLTSNKKKVNISIKNLHDISKRILMNPQELFCAKVDSKGDLVVFSFRAIKYMKEDQARSFYDGLSSTYNSIIWSYKIKELPHNFSGCTDYMIRFDENTQTTEFVEFADLNQFKVIDLSQHQLMELIRTLSDIDFDKQYIADLRGELRARREDIEASIDYEY